jgi:hypothetical protein
VFSGASRAAGGCLLGDGLPQADLQLRSTQPGVGVGLALLLLQPDMLRWEGVDRTNLGGCGRATATEGGDAHLSELEGTKWVAVVENTY